MLLSAGGPTYQVGKFPSLRYPRLGASVLLIIPAMAAKLVKCVCPHRSGHGWGPCQDTFSVRKSNILEYMGMLAKLIVKSCVTCGR